MSDQAEANWPTALLGSIGTFIRGRGGTRADESYDGVPCIRYGDLYTCHGEVLREFCSFVHPDRARAYTQLRQGDVVFAGSGETHEDIGRATAVLTEDPAVAGGDTIVFRPAEHADARFLGYAVNSEPAVKQKASLAQGSSVIHISPGHLGRVRVGLPNGRIQRRIAEILSTVDEAIQQTEALIAKLERVKQGMMHDLFTRGVTPDGRLRPPREEAPELYKESPLGWIPKEWEVVGMGECLVGNPINGVYKPADQIGRGILLVGQTAISAQRTIDFAAARRVEVRDEEVIRYRLENKDILMSRVFATIEGVGQPAFVESPPEPSVYESNMMRLRANQETTDPEWLFGWLRTRRARRALLSGANASNQTSINQSVLTRTPVSRPSRTEQSAVAGVIREITDRILIERRDMDKAEAVKHGLMQDLLTGRVRVNVSEESADV